MLNMHHKSLRFCANKMRIKLWKWIRQFESFLSPHSTRSHLFTIHSYFDCLQQQHSSQMGIIIGGKWHFSHPKYFICTEPKHRDVVEPKMIQIIINLSFHVTSAFCQRQRNQLRLNSFVRALLHGIWFSRYHSYRWLPPCHCVRRFNRLAPHSLLRKVHSLSFRIVSCSDPQAHLLIIILIVRELFSLIFVVAVYSTWMKLPLLALTRFVRMFHSRQANPLLIGSIRIDTYFGTCIVQSIFLWHVPIGSISNHYLRLTFLCPRWTYFCPCCRMAEHN